MNTPLYQQLIPMDLFCDDEPIALDLVYTDKDHPENIFQTNLYRPNVRLWVQYDLAVITLLTARLLHQKHEYTLILKDCLRTVDAQEAMQETDIVKQNPSWCIDGPDRLLAPPGKGAHPFAMAIDVGLVNDRGETIDMGSHFDQMDETSARHYTDFPEQILQNRQILEDSFIQSAQAHNKPLIPLPSEWWDFRLQKACFENYEPLRDADLPPQMQMCKIHPSQIDNLPDEHFEKLAQQIKALVDKLHANI